MSLEPTSAPSRPVSVHLSIALLALAIALFLAAQIGNAAQQNRAIRWQMSTGEKQIANLKESGTQVSELIKQQDTLVKQSAEIQAQYQKLLDDLLKLSEDDDDAKKIVEKWKVQRAANQPATATPPAADAKSATP